MQIHWGIVVTAVLMFVATLIFGQTSLTGNANPLYLLVWIMVGWYGYKGDLRSITSLMKWVILIAIAGVIFIYLFVGDNSSSVALGVKHATSVGIIIMLIPKAALFYYCSLKLKEEQVGDSNKSSSNSKTPISQSDFTSSRESAIVNDEIFYEKALVEFESNRRNGLWIKTLAKNEGDEIRSKYEYIRIRAKDIEIEEYALKESQIEQVKEYSSNDKIDSFQNKKETSIEELNNTPSIEFMPNTLSKYNDGNGSTKLKIPSVALSAVVGAASLERTEVVAKVWAYVKENNLQDANNRRSIIADDNLRKIFGKSKVTMFEMAQLINKHLM